MSEITNSSAVADPSAHVLIEQLKQQLSNREQQLATTEQRLQHAELRIQVLEERFTEAAHREIRCGQVCEPALEPRCEWEGSRTRDQDFKPDLLCGLPIYVVLSA